VSKQDDANSSNTHPCDCDGKGCECTNMVPSTEKSCFNCKQDLHRFPRD
jgi:hypothetical protein